VWGRLFPQKFVLKFFGEKRKTKLSNVRESR